MILAGCLGFVQAARVRRIGMVIARCILLAAAACIQRAGSCGVSLRLHGNAATALVGTRTGILMAKRQLTTIAQPLPHNEDLAEVFEETARLLEAQGANPYRVNAYRRGAETLRGLPQLAAHLLNTEGTVGLIRLPAIGRSLAHAIEKIVRTGRLPLLERLRGEETAEHQFATVPDIGSVLAHRIHQHLGIETLAELQAAAADGRLAKVPGMGLKRTRAVRESLAGRFRQDAFNETNLSRPMEDDVTVRELLEIDEEYRRMEACDELPRIAPRRFNPTQDAWLPILHTQREDRHYTALYSNTARAHAMGTTHDWVIIFRDDQQAHGQWTVITAQYGRLRGRRLVRGRESECQEFYDVQGAGRFPTQLPGFSVEHERKPG